MCGLIATSTIRLQVDEEKFASGAFRDAYKAKRLDPPNLRGEWVLKRYQEASLNTIKDVLGMSVEHHTRKQVQMHAVARNITQHFASKTPPQFKETFTYGEVFYSSLNGEPVTIEEFVPGDFFKYVNNDGICLESPSEEYEDVFRKAQCLVHFSYNYSGEKMMLLDIQGSMFSWYDPEIATAELNDDTDNSGEIYFCAGNLSHLSIDKFNSEHKCNQFCAMMNLAGTEMELTV